MDKKLAWIFVGFSFWGYLIGMADYRLFINTAESCYCWVKLAGLGLFMTVVMAIGIAVLYQKKKS
ncbi:hypothetical protein [Sulfuricurvum sp.]|uniref:hypothetical protein n=1 Tax=Sulfuricurvum sp. TaxID=2025608 RepID=UPI002606CED1|nr:hypothetical protein [Sulfuricurvum sp.]MDD3598177.1 hypothetical protein [Sulfuricurvum sp.]